MAPGNVRQKRAGGNYFTVASSLQSVRFPAKSAEKEKNERFSFAEVWRG